MRDLALTAYPLECPRKHTVSYETVTSSNIHCRFISILAAVQPAVYGSEEYFFKLDVNGKTIKKPYYPMKKKMKALKWKRKTYRLIFRSLLSLKTLKLSSNYDSSGKMAMILIQSQNYEQGKQQSLSSCAGDKESRNECGEQKELKHISQSVPAGYKFSKVRVSAVLSVAVNSLRALGCGRLNQQDNSMPVQKTAARVEAMPKQAQELKP
ncbi:hypothetical protein llap_8503 [Limosa lapponica baueri]|uniref:Uncharacterized protein n=1 Tax=Limosa lapponica baueri TaxID=1758121 RepID=A0A2I0U5A2_LIMLA|nr:hypothetical protein llap_8503 [Limosa lapponica baueri]